MKVSRMYLATIEILKQQPSTKTVKVEGESVSVKELIAALSKMMGWLYKELTTDDLEKVTRCCDCKNYKKEFCAITGFMLPDNYFCGSAEPRK